MSRYSRHTILSEIGPDGQEKLSNAKVLVVGAGGLGCPILQYLAAAGIGTLGIIDFDIVEESNLQRQVLFGKASLGDNKAIAAKKRLEDLNDGISIIAYPQMLTYQNAIDLFYQYNIIVDGSDNFETRYLANDACIITNKPLVFGAIYKFEGQVSLFNYKGGPSYRCLFPNPPQKDTVPNCTEVGVLGVLPGIIGIMQANEVLKIILEIGEVLSGKLYCFNALTLNSSILKIHKSDSEITKVLAAKNSFHKKEMVTFCETESTEVSIKDIISKENIQIIDVRETNEQPHVEDMSIIKIPLSSLEQNLHKINTNKESYFFCQTGIRSKKAIFILNGLKITNCYPIHEGAEEISNYLKKLNVIAMEKRQK